MATRHIVIVLQGNNLFTRVILKHLKQKGRERPF